MTPIAHALVRQRIRNDQTNNDRLNAGKFPTNLNEMRCFDCTAVSDLAYDLCDSMYEHARVPDKVAFLPAPITWIEYIMKPNMRVAIWLVDEGDGWARCGFAGVMKAENMQDCTDMVNIVGVDRALAICGKVCTTPTGHIQLSENVDKMGINVHAGTELLAENVRSVLLDKLSDASEERHMFLVYAFLSIINTPRIVGRKSRPAHKGLEREMNLRVSAKHRVKLPEWTEILLEVDKPAHDGEGGESGEILTGKRALHFCRSFIRIRLGRLELVKSHWRGDVALGVRQASYKVKFAQGVVA